MNRDYYVFQYSTKTKPLKAVSYGAYSLKEAVRRFRKNVRAVEVFGVWKNCKKIM